MTLNKVTKLTEEFKNENEASEDTKVVVCIWFLKFLKENISSSNSGSRIYKNIQKDNPLPHFLPTKD